MESEIEKSSIFESKYLEKHSLVKKGFESSKKLIKWDFQKGGLINRNLFKKIVAHKNVIGDFWRKSWQKMRVLQ